MPNLFVVQMVKLEVSGKNNYILDGFPRSVEQAKDIEDLNVDMVLFLAIAEKAVIERLSERRVCEKGIHGYHLKYLKPKREGICDVDGTKLIQRPDDKAVVIKERFKVYNKETAPVVDYYRKKGILFTVDATPLPERVYEDVKKVVKGRR